MWKCNNCSEQIDNDFDSCWKCGCLHDGSLPKEGGEISSEAVLLPSGQLLYVAEDQEPPWPSSEENMPPINPDNKSSESTASTVKPLPEGYLWLLGVRWALTLGGIVCMIFFNMIIGVLIAMAGLIFGKYSGLSEMNDSYCKDTEDTKP